MTEIDALIGPFPTVAELPIREDHLSVTQVDRFWRIFVNGQLLTKTRTIETPQGQQVETTPREFMREDQAWGFLGEKARVYPWLGWTIQIEEAQ